MPQQAKSAAPKGAPRFKPSGAKRHDGWTAAKQVAFVEALAASGCVREACAAVGMSAKSAYALRMRTEAQQFRMAWEAALDLAVRRIGDECFSRALHGEVIPHFYKGEQIGEHRRYDNRLAMWLMRYRDPLRYAATLDQMVYNGHPEKAAVEFARARNRVADEAHDMPIAEEDQPPPAPFAKTSLGEYLEDERERLIVEGNGPITGTNDRRDRLWDKRRDFQTKQQEEQAEALSAALAGKGPDTKVRGVAWVT